MITDADIKKLEKTFATKVFLKKELSRFATKDDLKAFATKEDLRSTTEELVGVIMEMTDNVIARIDKIIHRTETSEDEIQDHENRLRKVEDKVFAV